MIFHAEDANGHLKVFDMTELTGGDTDDPLLRFQSSYLSGSNAEVIFDSGTKDEII